MIKKEIIIEVEEGLHARPAAAFAKKAAEYKGTKIYVYKDSNKANAKSIMSILGLGAVKGTKIEVEADGPDEVAAIESLSSILA